MDLSRFVTMSFDTIYIKGVDPSSETLDAIILSDRKVVDESVSPFCSLGRKKCYHIEQLSKGDRLWKILTSMYEIFTFSIMYN